MLSTLARGFDKYGVGSACNCVPGMQVHVRHSDTFFCLAFPLPVSQGHEQVPFSETKQIACVLIRGSDDRAFHVEQLWDADCLEKEFHPLLANRVSKACVSVVRGVTSASLEAFLFLVFLQDFLLGMQSSRLTHK